MIAMHTLHNVCVSCQTVEGPGKHVHYIQPVHVDMAEEGVTVCAALFFKILSEKRLTIKE